MKNIAIAIFIAFIVITLSLYLISFQVRETESCLVTTFGKATRPLVEPGVHFKWPFPIQHVHKFDSRMRVFAPQVEETPSNASWSLKASAVTSSFGNWLKPCRRCTRLVRKRSVG